MNNPIVSKFLEEGLMFQDHTMIWAEYELDKHIRAEMDKNKMRADYYFKGTDGTLVFDNVLGRDCKGDFYNENNGNLEQRKQEIKKVIVGVLLHEYHSRYCTQA